MSTPARGLRPTSQTRRVQNRSPKGTERRFVHQRLARALFALGLVKVAGR